MVKYTQTIRLSFSVFDHFVGLVLKGLTLALNELMSMNTDRNPFQANVSFLYSLKMSENLWFFNIFRVHGELNCFENGTEHKSLKSFTD